MYLVMRALVVCVFFKLVKLHEITNAVMKAKTLKVSVADVDTYNNITYNYHQKVWNVLWTWSRPRIDWSRLLVFQKVTARATERLVMALPLHSVSLVARETCSESL